MSGPSDFADRLLHWFDRDGRHDLPWQHPRSAYRVWIAEIMLQQTRVATVIPYYQRFLQRFPDLPTLADASLDDVLALWSGLGYYSRARNLRQAAQLCVAQHDGELPQSQDALFALPGIGRSTAAAILAQSAGQRLAILDGNVKRVLCRLFGIDGWPGEPTVERQLWQLAGSLLPTRRLADYTQAIMDFGATLCRRHRPQCGECPFAADCVALKADRVGELPMPRARKALPQRRCTMLLLRDARGRWLLQRRPPIGVWASLWSLPQFDSAEQARHFAAAQGATLDAATPLPSFVHVFSHYRLQIEPLLLPLPGPALRVADNDDLRWIEAQGAATLGLPAPVRRLLADHLHGVINAA